MLNYKNLPGPSGGERPVSGKIGGAGVVSGDGPNPVGVVEEDTSEDTREFSEILGPGPLGQHPFAEGDTFPNFDPSSGAVITAHT